MALNKICIPVDFSTESMNTINFGAELALRLNYGIRLIHHIAPQYTGYSGMSGAMADYTVEAMKKATKDAEEKFETLGSDLRSEHPEWPVMEHKVKSGSFTAALTEEAEMADISLLMLTGEDQSNRLAWFLSETITPVIHASSVPVIIVPRRYPYRPVKKILYATDYNEEDIQSLRSLAVLARAFDAAITAVHITSSESFRERIEKEGFSKLVSDKVGFPVVSIESMPGKDVATGLREFASGIDADMIAMLKENRGFWEDMLFRSETEKMIFLADRPVMVFH